ncbi:MAG: hypothetical protein ACR2OY_02020, partial [Boseongicola sp.]
PIGTSIKKIGEQTAMFLIEQRKWQNIDENQTKITAIEGSADIGPLNHLSAPLNHPSWCVF